jgi:hypothetical protein
VTSSEALAAEGVESERPGPDQIQADIEQTREELGRTVEALSAKLDVKTRTSKRLGVAKEQVLHRTEAARQRSAELVTRAREAATDDLGRPKPAVPVGALIVVVAIVATVVWERRRHG